MNKWYPAVAASLVGGLAVAAIGLRQSAPEPLVVPDAGIGTPSERDPSAAERLAALEAALAAERDARQVLEDELLVLHGQIAALKAPAAPNETDARPDAPPTFGAVGSPPGIDRAGSEDQRIRLLVDGGFAPDRAGWIVRCEEELRVASMQARFDARRTGDRQALRAAALNPDAALRAEIGEAQYERYLEAYGRPVSVVVGNVLASSPGQRAGLQPGDEIVRYDGQRVFSTRDINLQQYEGEPGESVVIDVMRDGTLMQIVLPRGPIGIEAGRFRRR